MEAQNFIFCCFIVASSNAFSLLPSFLDPTSTILQNEDYDTFKIQNEIPVRNTPDDNLILDSSADKNVVAEPASAVLSHLRSMLDSPYEDAKQYASEKANELVSNLEHNSNKVMWFTLGGVHLLVDLGIRGSPTRLRNVEQGKSLMEYFGELYSLVTSYIGNWLSPTEPINKKVNQDHKQTDKNKAVDSKPDKDSTTDKLKDEKHLTKETDKPENNTSIIDEKPKKLSKDLDDKNDSNQPEEIKHEEKKEPILKLTPSDIFIPPKELTTEEKNDVEKARQRIITVEKNIHELDEKSKQRIEDDEKIRLNQLKDRLEILKKFIRISTSEHIK